MDDEYTHEIPVQYRDLDPRAHVNHAVYVSYMEQAKGRFMADELGTPLSEADTVIRHLELDYRAPIEAEERVAVTVRPVDVGGTSFTLEYELAVGGDADGEDEGEERVVATGRTVSVLVGPDGPRALPEAWRTALAPDA